jgi:hypothetical protein
VPFTLCLPPGSYKLRIAQGQDESGNTVGGWFYTTTQVLPSGEAITMTSLTSEASGATQVTASSLVGANLRLDTAAEAATKAEFLRLAWAPLVKSGNTRIGNRLSITVPPSAHPEIATTYQWYANGAKIKNAASPRWKVKSAFLAKRITVTVTYRLAQHLPVQRIAKFGKVKK